MMKINKRRDKDVSKLVLSSFKVDLVNNKTSQFYVKFRGPQSSPYQDVIMCLGIYELHQGQWKIHVMLPQQYPFKSPSIGFVNKIFHPNVDWMSGSVCLDVINQTWSPMYELINIFEIFLPQLLNYPNPTDPMNGQAARLYLQNKESYQNKVRQLVKAHAPYSQPKISEFKQDNKTDSDLKSNNAKKPFKLSSSYVVADENNNNDDDDDQQIQSVEDNSLSDVSDIQPVEFFSEGEGN